MFFSMFLSFLFVIRVSMVFYLELT